MAAVLPMLAADTEERAYLLASGAFDAGFYGAQVSLPEGTDLLRHYLDVGWRWGVDPRPGFEGAFLRPYYEAAGLRGAPLLNWLELSARGGRLPSTHGEAEARAQIIRGGTAWDPAWYERTLPPGLDPALHYVLVGEALGWTPSARFDPTFYAERYPDIPAIGLSPLLHYTMSGEREGRLPAPVASRLDFPKIAGGRGRPVIMLVHEASRTGAPVLGWALAERLRAQHDIVTVLLRLGTLEADFAAISAAVVGPMRWEEWHPTEMSRVAERLVREYDPLYAIANSIETSQMVPHLAMRGVPSVALVHEFAAYTRPVQKLLNAFDWASDIVFPARLVAESSFETVPHLARRRGVHVFPQGRVDPPRTAPKAATDRAATAVAGPAGGQAVRPSPEADQAFIVLGAGTVDLRKGVDVFISVAAACRRRAPELDIRFVWIGSGYDPENDVLYSAYIAEQLKRSGAAATMRFIKPVSDLDPVYAAADVFLMSSRLDPQPNVAIDALSRGLPVVCFDGASGTAEVLSGDPATSGLVAPYLDAAAAAEIIVGLATDRGAHSGLRAAVARLAARVFDMDGYTARVDAFGRAAAERLRPEDRATLTAAALDIDMVVPADAIVPGVDGLARVVQQQWATVGLSADQAGNAWFRRGQAGFHPQAYAEAHRADCVEGVRTPLAHWLEQGRPAGPWLRRVLPPLPSAARVGVRAVLHGHFHYPELLPNFLGRLDGNDTAVDLVLTTGSEEKAATMRAACAGRGGATVVVVPNRGRDIGPFIHLLPGMLEAGYEVVGHLHGKKSASTDEAMGDRWREFLWDNLLGTAPMMDTALAAFAASPALGLVFAEDPHLVGWDGNRALAAELAARMGMTGALPAFFDFPLGTMFWARTAALRPLAALGLGWEDYPPEPVPYDGTILHAIERLLPFIAGHAGFEAAGMRLPGTSW